jgi:hypothetical protein
VHRSGPWPNEGHCTLFDIIESLIVGQAALYLLWLNNKELLEQSCAFLI